MILTVYHQGRGTLLTNLFMIKEITDPQLPPHMGRLLRYSDPVEH
jgi:hypothetical protein